MELTIISGKGGTGKTMIAASLADISGCSVMADCDVDAPNLSLYYDGMDISKENFCASHKAEVMEFLCIGCGVCDAVCRFGAMKDHTVDAVSCEGCGACALACPEKAIRLMPMKEADIYLTRTADGILSRAEMAAGADGSGKLITQLRKNARRFLENDSLVIIDGSPGIGCPVISSITASDLALVVTEPTISGLADFKRIVGLCEHFGIATAVCINKCDVNKDAADEIKQYCHERQIPVIGEIPFDDMVVQSINELRPITKYPGSTARTAVLRMWERINAMILEIQR